MNKKILVVDDSAMIRMQVTRALRGAGFDVAEAIDGYDAWDKIDADISMMVCDVNMPQMNGLELLERLQSEPRGPLGLERRVAKRTEALHARTRDMRLILDSVAEGFLTVGPDLSMASERSAIVDAWFGAPRTTSFTEYLADADPRFAAWVELGWEALVDGVLPLTVALAQLPDRLDARGCSFAVRYRPILEDGVLSSMLVVIRDDSAEVAQRAAEARQRETVRVFQAFLDDKAGFLEFYGEADGLVTRLIEGKHQGDLSACRRDLHTLKGNSLMYGLETIAQLCHQMEEAILEDRAPPPDSALTQLRASWLGTQTSLEQLMSLHSGDAGVELTPAEYGSLMDAVTCGVSRDRILSMIRGWQLEPAERRLTRIAHHAAGIAEQLGKEDLRIEIEGHDLRLRSERFRSFWQAFVHVLRNAIDHGIESSSERLESGKSAAGLIRIATRVSHDQFIIEVRDDGRGIDWTAVALRAAAMGLPHGSREELIDALFSDGLSTRDTVTTMSGRGIGLGATREAAEELGGYVQVDTTLGEGTTVLFVFPLEGVGEDVWTSGDYQAAS